MIAHNLMNYYGNLGSDQDKRLFLSVIAGDLGVDHSLISSKAQNLVDLYFSVSTIGLTNVFFIQNLFITRKEVKTHY